MFHRGTTPSYFGGLPVTHDYINDPAANGDPGLPAPADGKLTVSGHPNEGTYFIGFGDDGTASNGNRPALALTENTDFIDDLLHADLAFPVGFVRHGVVSSQIVIDTAVDLGGAPIFVGPPGTANSEDGLAPYFRLTDEDDQDLVNGNPTNLPIVVTSVSPGGAVGTFYSGVLTLNLNTTPEVADVRVHMGIRSSLVEMGPAALVLAGVTSSPEAKASLIQFKNNLARAGLDTHGAQLVGVDTGNLTGFGLSGAAGGGIDNGALATLRDALGSIDRDLRARRGFTAVWTDGSQSTSGDFEQANIDGIVNSTYSGGVFMLRRGNYEISDTPSNWVGIKRVIGEGNAKAQIKLLSTRVADLVMPGEIELENVELVTDSATARFRTTASGAQAGFVLRRSTYDAGSYKFQGGSFLNYLEWEDVTTVTNSGFTGQNDALEHTQDGRATYRRCIFNQPAGTGNAIVNLHDVSSPTLSSIVFEECLFQSGLGTIYALKVNHNEVPVIFRNCVFRSLTPSGGTKHCVDIGDSSRIVFENCIIEAQNGRGVNIVNSSVTMRNCLIRDLGGTIEGQNPQLFVANGRDQLTDENPLTIKDCIIEYRDVVRNANADAPTLPFVEIGKNGFNVNGRVVVDGLIIKPVTGTTPGSHKYTSVILHGYTGTRLTGNVYRNVVFDAGDQAPEVTGSGLAGLYDVNSPAYIEVGTSTTDSQTLTTVENLRIAGVRVPSTSLFRRILVLNRCLATNVSVDGSGAGSGGVYTNNLVEIILSTVRGLYVFDINEVPTTASHVLLKERAKIIGGIQRGGGFANDPSAWLRLEGIFASVEDYYLLVNNAPFPIAAPIVSVDASHCSIAGCTFLFRGDPGNVATAVVATSNSDELRFQGNLIRWERNAANLILDQAGDRSVVTGNQFLSTAATAPIISSAGTDSVAANNVLAANASSIFT